MLKLLGVRSLSLRDAASVRQALDADPIAACTVAAQVEGRGMRSEYGELWTHNRPENSLCFAGSSLMPIVAEHDDLRAFADRASRAARCLSIVGRTDLALGLWEQLEQSWGPAREVRECQPLLAMMHESLVPADPSVRQVRTDQIDAYLKAAIEMFISEVGVDPRRGDGGVAYRRRIASLIAAGRAWARFVDGEVVFKAEIGAMSERVGQIHGVWVHPDYRSQGLGTAGTATVVNSIVASGRIASLYVNDFNIAARRSYERVGFTRVGTFSTVLFD